MRSNAYCSEKSLSLHKSPWRGSRLWSRNACDLSLMTPWSRQQSQFERNIEGTHIYLFSLHRKTTLLKKFFFWSLPISNIVYNFRKGTMPQADGFLFWFTTQAEATHYPLLPENPTSLSKLTEKFSLF